MAAGAGSDVVGRRGRTWRVKVKLTIRGRFVRLALALFVRDGIELLLCLGPRLHARGDLHGDGRCIQSTAQAMPDYNM